MKKLKKFVLKIPLNSHYELFDLFERYELLQIHRHGKDQISATQKVRFKDITMHPKMLEGKQYGLSNIEVIKENPGKNEFIFFSQHSFDDKTKDLLNKLDVIIDPPILLDHGHLLVRLIKDSKKIDEFFDFLDHYCENKVEILGVSHVDFHNETILSKLTDRQKEIVFYAVQRGYFEIPRRINSKKIASHFKISRAAFYDHMRKIERIVYHSIFN